jgi:hypothetical protein
MVKAIKREAWAICWAADGLILRLTIHTDIDEARVAAQGLADEGSMGMPEESTKPEPG